MTQSSYGPTLPRATMVAAIQLVNPAFSDAGKSDDFVHGVYSQIITNLFRDGSAPTAAIRANVQQLIGLDSASFAPPTSGAEQAVKVTKTDSRVSTSIVPQWASHRDNAARHLDHDPERKKEFLARFDAETIVGSRDYDRRFDARTAELKEIARLDASGPGEIGEVTKKQLESIAYFDRLSKRSQRGGSNGGNGHDAA